jgi:DNA adenine methylase
VAVWAPFPWFGGKRRAAPLVWRWFGDVPNYVEPFFGSGAVLLGRPTPPGIETVNDIDCYLSNFWRATAADPLEVARWTDWPVNEIDLHARHRWLVAREVFRERMVTDPDYCDAKIAGWWVWGISQWIGSGWCSMPQWEGRGHPGRCARGIHTATHSSHPDLSGDSGAAGRGVHASAKSPDTVASWMAALRHRLRRVRVCCGDWSRVLGASATTNIGITGVFLDPPYGADADRDPALYTYDNLELASQVRAWALEHGDNPRLRIALCGYEGEHVMPGWTCVAWRAHGGFAVNGSERKGNALRERIWFSPHCLQAYQPGLFGGRASMRRPEGMSIYRRVSCQMHADERVRALSKPQPCGLSLWWQCIAGEQTTIVPGLFKTGEAAWAEQLEWTLRGFRKAWEEVEEQGLARADWEARLVWIPKALRHNLPANPKVVIGWRYTWALLPECPLKDEAEASMLATLEDYSQACAEAFAKACGKAIAKPSPEPLAKSQAKQEAGSRKQEEDPSDPSRPAPKASATDSPGQGSLLPPVLSEFALYALSTWADLKPERIEQLEAGWREACPAVDLLATAKAARSWEMEKPSNRRTAHASFLGNWFRREQDNAHRHARPLAPPARPARGLVPASSREEHEADARDLERERGGRRDDE